MKNIKATHMVMLMMLLIIILPVRVLTQEVQTEPPTDPFFQRVLVTPAKSDQLEEVGKTFVERSMQLGEKMKSATLWAVAEDVEDFTSMVDSLPHGQKIVLVARDHRSGLVGSVKVSLR